MVYEKMSTRRWEFVETILWLDIWAKLFFGQNYGTALQTNFLLPPPQQIKRSQWPHKSSGRYKLAANKIWIFEFIFSRYNSTWSTYPCGPAYSQRMGRGYFHSHSCTCPCLSHAQCPYRCLWHSHLIFKIKVPATQFHASEYTVPRFEVPAAAPPSIWFHRPS